MPVTNRGPVQLTPGTTTTTTTTHNYLKSLSPSFDTIQAGLAAFALVIIVRFCATCIYVWFRRLYGVDKPTSPRPIIIQYQQHPRPRRSWMMMDEKIRSEDNAVEAKDDGVVYVQEKGSMGAPLSIDPNWSSTAFSSDLPRPFVSRPPPAPPLTPPELSTAVFTFEDRPRSGDDSFMNQPNPDYMSSTTAMSAESTPSPAIPRRRSYNKTLPIGVPMPISQQSSTISDAADLTFSPSSYPPTSPLLPPAPPTSGPMQIGVQGEIVGLLNDDGAGWTRHTRVYGGGVCLACAASGGNHGGGFYGATVRPEEMR